MTRRAVLCWTSRQLSSSTFDVALTLQEGIYVSFELASVCDVFVLFNTAYQYRDGVSPAAAWTELPTQARWSQDRDGKL